MRNLPHVSAFVLMRSLTKPIFRDAGLLLLLSTGLHLPQCILLDCSRSHLKENGLHSWRHHGIYSAQVILRNIPARAGLQQIESSSGFLQSNSSSGLPCSPNSKNSNITRQEPHLGAGSLPLDWTHRYHGADLPTSQYHISRSISVLSPSPGLTDHDPRSRM